MKNLSVIIPFYNGEKYISRLLSSLSVSSTIIYNINFQWELIIIVDSPNTEVIQLQQIISDFEYQKSDVHVFKNEYNIGVAATRNRGLLESKGEYIYFLDQDDEVSVDFFQKVMKPILEKYDFILLNGNIVYNESYRSQHKIFYLSPKIRIQRLIVDDLIRSPGQVVIGRRALADLKFPIPKHHFGSDDKFLWILIFMLNNCLKVRYIHEPIYIAHIHDRNFSKDRLELQRCSLEMWEYIQNNYCTSKINDLIAANKAYLKYVLRREYSLSTMEIIKGFCEYLKYFLNANKIMRYIIKKINN